MSKNYCCVVRAHYITVNPNPTQPLPPFFTIYFSVDRKIKRKARISAICKSSPACW